MSHGRKVIYTDFDTVTRDNVLQLVNTAMLTHLDNRNDIQNLYNYYRGKTPIMNKTKEVREEIREQARKDREWIEEHSKPAEEQIAGQMKMDLKTEEPAEEKPEMSDMTKMMRFQAHLADRIIKKLDEILAELRRTDA